MNSELETLEHNLGANPDAAVIWLHGLGADGHDFEPILPMLAAAGVSNTRFVFPNAPVRPVTINGGMPMRAWYDIRSLDSEGRADREGLLESAAAVDALIQREKERGIHASRIVLAGFSQGGAVILQTGCRHAEPLAGMVALSTYVALASDLKASAHLNTSTPIFMAHGQLDDVVPFAMGSESRAVLVELGFAVQWSSYPMGHAVLPEEIEAIATFLTGVL